MPQKARIHNQHSIRSFSEGEIWWCGVGENIGVEIDGKDNEYARPVIIFKKLGRFGFFGIPLTSQEHENSWYVKFLFKEKAEYAALSQFKMMSSLRLYRRIGKMDEKDFEKIAIGVCELLFKKCPQSRMRGVGENNPRIML